MNTTKKTLRQGRLIVSLDRSKVHPDDPGADTPAIVHCFGYSATYWCACGEGELTRWNGSAMQLTQKECEWLESIDTEVTEFLYGERS